MPIVDTLPLCVDGIAEGIGRGGEIKIGGSFAGESMLGSNVMWGPIVAVEPCDRCPRLLMCGGSLEPDDPAEIILLARDETLDVIAGPTTRTGPPEGALKLERAETYPPRAGYREGARLK